MRDLDLTSLRLFIAVCEEGNLARVADQNSLVASAVSKRMAQLEADVGTPLLIRNRRGVSPTPAGLALLEHAHAVRVTMSRIDRDLSAFASGIRGHVRLLASASALAESLPDDLSEFLKQPAHQDIQVDLQEELSSEVVRSLHDGSASVGICWDIANLAGLITYPYRSDHLAVVAHPEHPLALAVRPLAAIPFENTLVHEHTGILASSAVQQMLARAAAIHGKQVAYRAVVSTFDAAMRIVRSNLSIAIVPREIAEPYARMTGLRIIDLEDAWAHRRFAVCHRDLQTLSPAATLLVAHLRSKGDAHP